MGLPGHSKWSATSQCRASASASMCLKSFRLKVTSAAASVYKRITRKDDVTGQSDGSLSSNAALGRMT